MQTSSATISKPEPAILCGGLLRLWETPATFAPISFPEPAILGKEREALGYSVSGRKLMGR
jgi:hypothetical protein